LFDLISHISDLRLSALCLCASAPLHLTKLSSFVIVFMQNKANFRKSQVNVRPLVIMNYERKSDWTPGENKPNSKPIQTQSNPIAERVKLMQSVYLQRNMKKNAAKGYEKTKPKQTQFKAKQSQFPSRNAKNAPPPISIYGEYLNRTWPHLRNTRFEKHAEEFQDYKNWPGLKIRATTSLKAVAQWSAFLGRKNMPGPTPSGYGTVPSAVMETFIGTTSEAE